MVSFLLRMLKRLEPIQFIALATCGILIHVPRASLLWIRSYILLLPTFTLLFDI
jgi:hypothetical protein